MLNRDCRGRDSWLPVGRLHVSTMKGGSGDALWQGDSDMDLLSVSVIVMNVGCEVEGI
jgi:hypothetical protein